MTWEPIAALFVERDGVYANLIGVDVWDEARDARLYNGPFPVVAHPPCARWSRLAGFTEARFGYRRGDDGGCFTAALNAVRAYGGVLEHPAYSKAWDAYNLPEPLWRGGWNAGTCGGWSCYVEQGRYGLPVKKATWLYAYGVELPELRWGYTPDGEGERPNGPWGGIDGWRDSWTTKDSGGTSRTPAEFRDALLAIARSAYDWRRDEEALGDSRCRESEDAEGHSGARAADEGRPGRGRPHRQPLAASDSERAAQSAALTESTTVGGRPGEGTPP